MSAAASAQVFSFSFTGTMSGIVDPGTFLPDEFQSGQAVFGTIRYDLSNVTDHSPADPDFGNYRFINGAAGDLTMSVSVVTPGHTFVFSSVAAPANQDNKIEVIRGAASDHMLNYILGDPLLDGFALPATGSGSSMVINLSDSSETALANDSAPAFVPALPAFDGAMFQVLGYETGGVFAYGFSANITGITPVPEPGDWAAVAGGALGAFALVRRRQRAGTGR